MIIGLNPYRITDFIVIRFEEAKVNLKSNVPILWQFLSDKKLKFCNSLTDEFILLNRDKVIYQGKFISINS